MIELKRKKRNWLEFLVLWFAGGAIISLFGYSNVEIIIAIVLQMIFCYGIVGALSTYDIKEWGKAQKYIFMAGVFGIIGSAVVYYFIRSKVITESVRCQELDVELHNEIETKYNMGKA